MKWRLARAKLVQSYPHDLQGVGVHDVEAAASVHEHLGEAGVADDGIHDEWILSRIWDVVGVVLAAEGDCILRPVEVGRRSLGDGEDFSTLALALSSGHVRRRPAKDEERVLHPRVVVAALSFFVLFLLGLVLAAEAVEVLAEHVTLFEGVVNLALVVRAWFL